MRSVLTSLRTGLLLLLVLVSGRAALADAPYSDARFWRIERDGAEPSFILGTLHVSDPEVTTLSPGISRAFDGSQALAVELTMDQETQIVLHVASMAADNRWMDRRLDNRQRSLLADVAGRYKIPVADLRAFEPWAVQMLFSVPVEELQRQAEGVKQLDMQLMDKAEASGKRLIALERVEEQLHAITDYSDQEQIDMLTQTLENVDHIDRDFARMKGAYLAGDLAEISAMADESFAELDPGLSGRVQQRLIADRNRHMAERLEPLLNQGRLFVAVGALHLPGDGGVLNLLAQRGYRITAVE